MNRTDRLVALVMLLQSRRVITAAEMASHFEITERTVYRDIAALGEGGVPIVGEPGVGYSLMRGYQLPPVMFSPSEAFALVTGGLLAESMTDDSVREALRTSLGKLTAVLPGELQDRVHRLQDAMRVTRQKPVAGPVPLSRIQMGMAEGKVMTLNYLGASRGEPTAREIEPLGLVYYLDHWHLIAWCRLRNDVRDFRVDRIVACTVEHEPTPPRPDFDLAEYLSRCLGPDTTTEAVVEFHPRLMDSVRRNWGPMLLEENAVEGGVRVKLSIGESPYFARWLLSFGDKVKIIEPESLRLDLLNEARAAIGHHEKK